jgi:hypothetical protein
MTRDQFDDLVRVARESFASWFDQVEEPASSDVLATVERELNVALPAEYRAFLAEHGAGYFGRVPIYSADPTSEWHLLGSGREALIARRFVAISEDEAGGFYGFQCQSGACGAEVMYWYPDEANPPKLVAPSFYDWVVEMGLP